MDKISKTNQPDANTSKIANKTTPIQRTMIILFQILGEKSFSYFAQKDLDEFMAEVREHTRDGPTVNPDAEKYVKEFSATSKAERRKKLRHEWGLSFRK